MVLLLFSRPVSTSEGERAEGMWKDLVRKGWEKVPAVWGPDAEP